MLVKALDAAFRERMLEVMDQSQHTSADSGGEGAAYEFCQGLDTWEKQRTSRLSVLERHPADRIPPCGLAVFHRGETAAKEFKSYSELKSKKPGR